MLARPHLRALLEHHDAEAFSAVEKTIDTLRRSEALHKVKRLWGSAWRTHVASEMQVIASDCFRLLLILLIAAGGARTSPASCR